MMYVFNRITVNPQLPKRINKLTEIANNLWWSWNTEFLRLLKRIDLDLWETVGKNPVKFLKTVSQEKLGELIDVATAYVSRVERGSSHVNLKKLSQISVALNTPIEELVSDTTTKSKNYLSKEFQEILSKCTPDQQSLIYNIARIVSEIEFI